MVVRLIDEAEEAIAPKTEIEKTIELYCDSIYKIFDELNTTLSTPVKYDETTGAPIFSKTKPGFDYLAYNKIISRPIYVNEDTIFRIGYAGPYCSDGRDNGRLAFFDEIGWEKVFPGNNNQTTEMVINTLKVWIKSDEEMADFIKYYTETFLTEM